MKSYGKAIKETLDEEMRKDSSIFLIGEDVGKYGGCFGISQGLFEKYGPGRVIDSPMSEQAIVGLGIGAALNGLKPIVEIMFMDFMTLAYDQLFNHASIFNYLTNSNKSVPLVIRVPAGAGRGYGATHSKTLIAPLMHIPGIKIVAPSNPRDASCLLRKAIHDKNPVIFVEHKLLYFKKQEESEENKFEDLEDFEIGEAKVIKEGKDILIISFSKTIEDVLEAAKNLEKRGISCEIIDLRTIKPLDMNTIKSSVEKIKKVLIVEEGYSECGVASEIISRINEECFYYLDAPVRRLSSLNVPISCCKEYEDICIPSVNKIEEKVMEILNE